MKTLVLAVALTLAPISALAHKVIVGVFPSGDAIEGEIGLSNGEMAADQEVIVTAPDGSELGRTTTDGDGFFLFTPSRPVAHTFHADLGAGHVAKVTMAAKEVARIMGVADAEPERGVASAETPDPAPAGVTVAALTEDERRAISEAVREEMRPLRREISAYREHNDLQSILGGIGYIFGLFGLGFYLAARRKLGG